MGKHEELTAMTTVFCLVKYIWFMEFQILLYMTLHNVLYGKFEFKLVSCVMKVLFPN